MNYYFATTLRAMDFEAAIEKVTDVDETDLPEEFQSSYTTQMPTTTLKDTPIVEGMEE